MVKSVTSNLFFDVFIPAIASAGTFELVRKNDMMHYTLLAESNTLKAVDIGSLESKGRVAIIEHLKRTIPMKCLYISRGQREEAIAWQQIHLPRWFHNLYKSATFTEVVNTAQKLRKFLWKWRMFWQTQGKLKRIAVVDIFTKRDSRV